MWYATAAVIIILVIIWGAWYVGKISGKNEEKKEGAETRAEDREVWEWGNRLRVLCIQLGTCKDE